MLPAGPAHHLRKETQKLGVYTKSQSCRGHQKEGLLYVLLLLWSPLNAVAFTFGAFRLDLVQCGHLLGARSDVDTLYLAFGFSPASTTLLLLVSTYMTLSCTVELEGCMKSGTHHCYICEVVFLLV